ncbi:hypothetical protein LIER_12989 [Lithospermum erythrorhizon]|uniref:Uncharacterized protein n=1 Tax=Lithospermum erythrorhizon TaxID=34254 RepID=A0AAV3PTU1_LITER
MEADLSRVLGTLSLERDELGEVFVPDITYDRVEEKYQFSLVGRVLTKRRFHVQTFKETMRALWGGHEGIVGFICAMEGRDTGIPNCVEYSSMFGTNLASLLGFFQAEIGHAVGAHIGTVLDVDTRSLERERGRYVMVKPYNEVPEDVPQPVNLRTGGTLHEVGSSHPLEMAGIIHGMTETIVDTVMQQL